MDNGTVAIITARGGSKRIPKKNIKDFCGKPILSYSIEAALKSGLFEEVMVSTDSKEIADTAAQYGAAVPFMRSERASDDYATTADVIFEVLNKYKEIGRSFPYAVCIYPTAPFVTPEKLRYGMERLKQEQGVMAMPVAAFSYPPQRSYLLKDGRLNMKWKENLNARSQDLEPFYHDCGQFYIYDVKRFLELGGQVTENIIPLIMDEMEVQDIDNEADWRLAEIKYRMMAEKRREDTIPREAGRLPLEGQVNG